MHINLKGVIYMDTEARITLMEDQMEAWSDDFNLLGERVAHLEAAIAALAVLTDGLRDCISTQLSLFKDASSS